MVGYLLWRFAVEFIKPVWVLPIGISPIQLGCTGRAFILCRAKFISPPYCVGRNSFRLHLPTEAKLGEIRRNEFRPTLKNLVVFQKEAERIGRFQPKGVWLVVHYHLREMVVENIIEQVERKPFDYPNTQAILPQHVASC